MSLGTVMTGEQKVLGFNIKHFIIMYYLHIQSDKHELDNFNLKSLIYLNLHIIIKFWRFVFGVFRKI